MIKENLNLFLGNGGLAGVNRPEKLFKLSVSCPMPQAPNCRPEVMNNMFFGFLEQAIHETCDLLIEKGQKSLNSKLKERDKDPVTPLTPEDLLLILAQFQFLDAKTISGGGLVDKDISGASAIRWFVKTQPNANRLDKDMLKDIISTLGRNEKVNIQLKEGKDEITIRLKPEVLGRLKIKVGWDQGMLKVNFFATTHIAKQVLEQNLNILSQMLLQQGLPVGEMSVLLEPDGHAPNGRRELVRYPKRIGTITHFVKSVSPEVPLGKDSSLDILA
ncbi:MAG: flagellar hook-length control protein FliK [Deltaproteobacteria bacterium]|nr:flagellar hook-length control protein FliK [Deltaproteobacteria bacterium]